ncbi:LysR family transcriptional regulator [Agromyces sp. SYSU K20354]|uniref:LysR family transcriptional regulator n=1 Tax=Agromyces cavernae TaxID=2898659 RepID=UPI001E2F4E95|nr:LysR family transcriptional regulator [Agromyces cavernae]MCD2440950.1 LysR family transcriptional regulator [Agromyces cavernae]
MYDLHRLRLLRELKHRGTLAAVGEALGYSASAISHQLAILEREVGAPVLEPVGRRVRLTDAAELLVAHTERVLLELEQAEAAIAASRATVSGQVRIATFQTAAHAIIPGALDLLADEHPGVVATFRHVHAEQALPALLARDVDLVLYEEYPGSPAAPITNITTEHLLDDPMLIATPAGREVGGLPDLADARWAMEPPGTRSREWAVATCRAAGFEPAVAFESVDVLLHARLVARGQAVAFLPALIAADAAGCVLEPTGDGRAIRLAFRSGSEANPALAAARRAMRAHVSGAGSSMVDG